MHGSFHPRGVLLVLAAVFAPGVAGWWGLQDCRCFRPHHDEQRTPGESAVSFQPIGGEGNENPGIGCDRKTDPRMAAYQADPGRLGQEVAVLCTHRVAITLPFAAPSKNRMLRRDHRPAHPRQVEQSVGTHRLTCRKEEPPSSRFLREST